MNQDKYFISSTTDNPAGALGKWDAYINDGVQVRSEKPVSIQGNREFSTLERAENYVFKHSSAFPGIIVTVSDDTTASNNGAYLVEHGTVSETNPNGLKLTKLAQGGEAQNQLEWSNYTDDSFETGSTGA